MFRRSSHYRYRLLEPGELAATWRSFLGRFAEGVSVDGKLSRELPHDTSSLTEVRDPLELEDVCELAEHMLWASFHDTSQRWISITLRATTEMVALDISAETADLLREIQGHFTTGLSLEPFIPPAGGADQDTESQSLAVADLSARLAAVEATLAGIAPTLRCFLSYRFNDQNELAALRMQRFLALLDVEVLSGQGYEPRSVSQKVSDRLGARVDFLLLLVQEDGESAWTRDEIATARAKGIPVIPVVQDGIGFAPGVFGDLEYISFSPGHVGDAFLSLLEAVRFIRADQNAAVGAPTGSDT